MRADAISWSRRAVLGLVPTGALAMTGAASAMAGGSGPAKDGPVSVAYVEVNNHDLSVVGDYVLEGSGTAVFDVAIIFAANINYDTEAGAAYLHLNERTQWIVDNAATQIRPLQERGIRVLLSVLGNHEGAGVANFPDAAAADAFAAQLADAVQTYGLDGIDIDDEYADYGQNGTGQPNDHSFVELVSALRARLGDDKLITFYNIGPAATRTEHDGVRAGDLMDYAWNPYYSTWQVPDIPGMGPSQCSPGAVDIQSTPAATAASYAERTVAEGYGVYLTYNLGGGDYSTYVSSFSNPLYGANAAYTG